MKTSALAAAAIVVIALWLALAAAAPLLAPYEPLRQDMARRLAAPSAVDWLVRKFKYAEISVWIGVAGVFTIIGMTVWEGLVAH